MEPPLEADYGQTGRRWAPYVWYSCSEIYEEQEVSWYNRDKTYSLGGRVEPIHMEDSVIIYILVHLEARASKDG